MKKAMFITIAAALITLGYFLRDTVDFVTDLEKGKATLRTIPTSVNFGNWLRLAGTLSQPSATLTIHLALKS